MCAAAQCRTDVFAQGAYISAFATAHADVQLITRKTIQVQLMYHHVAQLTMNGLAVAYVFVQRFALVLERAIHGWQLLYRPAKLRQHRAHLIQCRGHLMLGDHLAFGISCRGGLSETHGGTIAFISIQQSIRKFGRLAKTDRQQTGGKRIERAGVPGFFRLEQAAHFLQGDIGA